MKNYLFFIIKSKVNINVKGNNIERFIKRLKNNNIEILNITYISRDEINVKIYKNDYEKVLDIKTIYDIKILNYYGAAKLKNNILNNKFIIILIVIAFIFLYIISSMIFEIDIITNDSKMEFTLREELNDLGIKKYNFKKSYTEIQNIKKQLLDNHKSEIEWIEIENIGTKYIIRYEPRVLNEEKESTPLRHIIAKKDAIISDMNISSGQIIKEVKSYVKKGDVIVSGYITLNGNIKDTVSSKGIIYGETWYNVKVTYPYKYYQNYETGNNKTVFVIKILNKELELFNFNKYETKNIKDYTILKNNILPIKLVKQLQKETNIIDENNTKEEVVEKAVDYSKKKLESNLSNKEYIKDYKILNKIENEDSITLNIFFNIIENITEYQEIEEYVETDQEKESN